MKTAKSILFIASFGISIVSFGQGAVSPQKETTPEIIFATQAEKKEAILKLENRIKIDMTDQTFPADMLEKEKQELARTKKAKVQEVKK